MRKQFQHALAGVRTAQRAPPAKFLRQVSAFSNQFRRGKIKKSTPKTRRIGSKTFCVHLETQQSAQLNHNCD